MNFDVLEHLCIYVHDTYHFQKIIRVHDIIDGS